ncbi:MAG: bifunctional nuclease family protein [Acidobacteria bacterium]|nr:bifunctional nuclease family protein [Acidobacteriota bacterium]
MTDLAEEIQMKISGLILDPNSKVPIVVLKDLGDEYFLPIWIGVFEANAIAMSIEGIETPRPMTHDLLFSMVQKLGGTLKRIVITDLEDSTFFALIHVDLNGGSLEIDSRPSDALALALRAKIPFFVTRTVLEKAKIDEKVARLTEEERIKKWLEEVSPEDLGKYKM